MGRRWVALAVTIVACLSVMAAAPVRVTYRCVTLAADKGEVCYCPPNYDCATSQTHTEWAYVARIFGGDAVLAKDALYDENAGDVLRNFAGALVIGGLAYMGLRRDWRGKRTDI